MKEMRDLIALEYMKVVISNNERLMDYIDEENVMDSIAVDAYKMADAMIKASTKD